MAIDTIDTEAMARNADEAVRFVKAIGNQKRMLILCHLANCERSVTELEHLLKLRQSSISQELSRLRRNGMVVARRSSKQVFYKIADPKVEEVISSGSRIRSCMTCV